MLRSHLFRPVRNYSLTPMKCILSRRGLSTSTSTRQSSINLFTPKCIKRYKVTSSVDWKYIKTHNNPNGSTNRKFSIWKVCALGLMVAMPAVSFYLGCWQLRRLHWKTNLIADGESKLTYEPVDLPRDFQECDCSDWEYRKVKLTGKFIYEDEIFVGPKSFNAEKGYQLFTPFEVKDTGKRYLVERGWISEKCVLPERRSLHHLSTPMGDNITIVCLVRTVKKRGQFQWKKNETGSRIWEIPDFYDMARTVNCPLIHLQMVYDMRDHPEWKVSSKVETKGNSMSHLLSWWPTKNKIQKTPTSETHAHDTEFAEWQFMKAGVPIGKKPVVEYRNNHFQYLATWFGLSLMSSVYLVVAVRKYYRGNVVSQSRIQREQLKKAQKFL